MIKLNDRFSFERDKYQWILYETIPIESENGEPKTKVKKTYHANLQQECDYITDKRLGGCQSLEEIKKLLTATVKLMHAYVKQYENIPG
jgi:hypothetical protein